MTQVSKDMSAGSCTVIDSPAVIKYLLVAIFLTIIGIFLFLVGLAVSADPSEEGGGGFIAFGCLFVVIGLLNALWFRANKGGYIIDTENDVLEFPGDGIEAESWLSYFTFTYWFQGFMRHQRPLSEIRHINAYEDVNTRVHTDDKGRVRSTTRKSNILEIDGDFGAVRFVFSSKQKMGQLYSAIVQLLEMGAPVVKR